MPNAQISAQAQAILARCPRVDGQTDSDVLGIAIDRWSAYSVLAKSAEGADLKINLAELDQRLKIISQMQAADFSAVKATACAKALFVDQSTETLDAAFKCFAVDGSETISLEEFKKVMPTMAEDFPEDKLDDLVKEVDSDGSGNIDSKEFGRLILGLTGKAPFSFGFNMFKMPEMKMPEMPEMPKMPELEMPKMPEMPAMPEMPKMPELEMPKMPEMPQMGYPWSKEVEGSKEAEGAENSASMSERFTPAWVKAAQTEWDESVAGFATAYKAGLPGLLPHEWIKVGKIMNKMTEAGYSEDKAKSVCKAMFCAQSEDDLKAAFDLFDTEGKGAMSAEDFTKMMPCLGEDMPEEKVAETLKQVDKDNSGKLEFKEFAALVALLNPKQQAAEEAKNKPGWLDGLNGGLNGLTGSTEEPAAEKKPEEPEAEKKPEEPAAEKKPEEPAAEKKPE